MPRAWKLAGTLALTALCLPSMARSSEPASAKPTELENLEKRLNARLDALERSLDTSMKNKLAGVEDRLDTMQRELASLTRRLDSVERTGVRDSEVQSLRDQMERLRNDLDSVRRSESRLRESMKPSTDGTLPIDHVAPAPSISRRMTFGTLRVTNDFPIFQEVIVNNRSFSIPPATTMDISVPAGPFSYSVVNDPVGVRAHTMTANGLRSVRIWP